ncbi:MAG: tRNA1(Val) (adenine(37)-N6)-methyltransferase [Rhodospirillaceae bacterium]
MVPSDTASTDDRLLDGRVHIRQPASGYRVAVDPVLLAAATPARAGQHVLDAGCGTGAAMFCLAARVPGVQLTGIEIQETLADHARAGIGLNRLDGAARILSGDIARGNHGVFDLVMTNPPFGDDGTPPPDDSLARAHMESHLDLAGWIKACLAALRPKGRLVMIHRADRLSDILAALAGRAGDIRIRPIYPKSGQPARRVIVDAGKDRRTPDTLLPGLVLHEESGAFTAAADAVLRSAGALL